MERKKTQDRGWGGPRVQVENQTCLLVQETSPGQECLSGLGDLGLFHFKGLLLPGVSYKKSERKRHSINLH